MRLFALMLVLFAGNVAADWQIDPQRSALHFMSTKNTHIVETHSFDTFTGSLRDDGALSVDIDLGSVNTLIDIRNTRMRDMLFNVASFASAEFSTTLPPAIMAMKTGEAAMHDIAGSFTLHGKTHNVSASVYITKLTDNAFSAVTLKPIIIDARDFELKSGVDALQKIAGLENIGYTIPVSFAVTFTDQA